MHIRKEVEQLDTFYSVICQKPRYFNMLEISNDTNTLTASEVIKFIICRIPLNPIYCIESAYGIRYPIVNQTYLKMVSAYINNEFPLEHVGFGLDSMYYKDLTPLRRSHIDDYKFTFITFQPPMELEIVSSLLNTLGIINSDVIINKIME